MIHIVMFKMKSNDVIEETVELMKKTYKVIKANYSVVHGYEIHTNVVERDSNMDIMIKVDLEDKAALTTYLESPEHVELVNNIIKNVEKKVSFDFFA